MIFRIVGTIILVLLLVAVGIFLLLMLLPARIEVKRKMPSGPLRVRIGFGPVRRVWTLGEPRKKKPKPKKEKAKPATPKKEKQPREPRAPWVDIKRLDYGQALSLALNLIDDMTGTMTWERLHVTLILHTPDAGQTGRLLGILSAFVGNLYPYLERAFVLKDTRIVIDADFDAQHTVWGLDVSVMTRFCRFPAILWRRKKELWDLWKLIRTTKAERMQWKQDHAASADDQGEEHERA